MARALWLVGILMVLAALWMGFISWLVTRAVSIPLRSLGEAAKRVGEGEFEAPITVIGAEEFAVMGTRMNHMRLHLRQSVGDLRAANRDLAVRSSELQMANKELEAFSYSVSHDLRAPLRAVNGFSRIVNDEYGHQLPDEGRRYLQLVIDNATQMGRLIDDLLQFSRLSRQAVVRQSVDMTTLAREVVADMPPAGAMIPQVEVESLPPCQGDLNLLGQGLANLVENAFKYSRKRQEPRVTIGASADGNSAIYWVRDNGVGFDMRYAHKLFGVFQRLHRAEDFEGTGVGLAIVQRIVQRHGGRVWAESVVDKGATFFFTVSEEKAE